MLNTIDKIIRHKAGLLNLAEELGPKARQCVEGLPGDGLFARYILSL